MSSSTNQEVPVNESSHLDTKAFGVTCTSDVPPTLFSVDDVVFTPMADYSVRTPRGQGIRFVLKAVVLYTLVQIAEPCIAGADLDVDPVSTCAARRPYTEYAGFTSRTTC